MFDFYENRKIRSILYSKVVVGILLLGTALLATSVYDRYTVASDMQEKLDSRRTALGELEQRAEMLKTKVEYLENDRGVEEELRNRFDVAREGEQVVVLIDSLPEKNTTQEASNGDKVPGTEPKKSFFELFMFWKF